MGGAAGVVPVEYVERDFGAETLADAQLVDAALTMDISEAGFCFDRPDFFTFAEFSVSRTAGSRSASVFAAGRSGAEAISDVYTFRALGSQVIRYRIYPWANLSLGNSADNAPMNIGEDDADSFSKVRTFNDNFVLSDESCTRLTSFTGAETRTNEYTDVPSVGVQLLEWFAVLPSGTQWGLTSISPVSQTMKVRLRGAQISNPDSTREYLFEPVRTSGGCGFREVNSGTLLIVDAPSVTAGPDLGGSS